MSPRTRGLLLGFALLGLAFAGGAAYVHYRLLTEPNYLSPCDINARFNCSEVYLSQYGSVGGVSVALLGVIFFVVVGLIAALAEGRAKDAATPATSYVFALSTVGLAGILYLGWASLFVLKTYCVLCIGTYASVIGLFLVSGARSSFPMARLPGRLFGDLRAIVGRPVRLLVTLAAVAFSISLVGCFPRESGTEASSASTSNAASTAESAGEEENFDKIWAQQPRVDLGIPTDGAKVVIVKFIDWQCPSCKAAHHAYEPILQKYAQTPGAIRVVTKDYPLNGRCNFNVAGAGHAAACEAAAAVRLANERGKGGEMIEWLFARQQSLTPQAVEAEVRSRFGITDFGREFTRLLPDIKRDVADGGALHVQFTPTYFINGVKAQTPDGGWIAAQYFEYAIRYELKKAETK